MGTFIGHILPGAGFILIGVWHIFNILRNYVEAPWNFESKTWFPTRWRGKWKYLELYLIIFGSFMSIAAELFICPKRHQPFYDDWSIPIDHLNNFEHSTISLFFLVFGVTNLCCEVLKIQLPRGLLHVMAAFAFSQELLLFHFHSADHMGLEGHYHWLLQLPIIVVLVCVLMEIAAPKAVIVSLVRGVAILFQGSWFIQMGLSLWIPYLIPNGCEMRDHQGHFQVSCSSPDADMRAKALANLAFSWHLIIILVMTLFLYIGMMVHHSRQQQQQYEPLMGIHHVKNMERSSQDEINLKDVEATANSSPRSSHDGQGVESDIEMQPCISLER